MSTRLTAKQRLFVENYVVHYNAARAVKQTYGENPHRRGTDAWARFEASARARGSEMLTKPNVLHLVQQRQARIRQKFEFDEDMVVTALAGIVFTDLKDVGDWTEEGEFYLKRPEDIADFHHGAIRGIRYRKNTVTRKGKGEAEDEVEVETHLEVLMHRDKVPAAKLLLQHGGWLARGVRDIYAAKGAEVNVDARTQTLALVEKLEGLTVDEILAAAERMPAEPEE